MQVRVGEEVFRSKEALGEKCKGILYSYSLGQTVPGVHWRLRDDFLRGVQGSLSQISVQPWREGEHRILFADRTFAVSWAAYHQRHAVLRITSSGANLSR